MTTLHRPMLGTLMAIPLLLLAGACGPGEGGSASKAASDDSGGASTGSLAEPAPAGEPDTGLQTERSSASGDTTTSKGQEPVDPVGATSPMSRAVISTGAVIVHSPSINRVRSEVMRLVGSWNGTIAEEQTSSDDHGRVVDSSMTLRVPTAKFSLAMDALADLGEVEHQSRTSEDVTTQVIDNQARVRAAERSIRQIERLLGRARQIGDIIAIESDLARRQADLDSLKSQQAWLADQTSLSTINVHVSRPSRADDDRAASGFLAGLGDGWDALRTSTVSLLTVLGAVLPFAVMLALVGVPLWLVVRRRRAPARAMATET